MTFNRISFANSMCAHVFLWMWENSLRTSLMHTNIDLHKSFLTCDIVVLLILIIRWSIKLQEWGDSEQTDVGWYGWQCWDCRHLNNYDTNLHAEDILDLLTDDSGLFDASCLCWASSSLTSSSSFCCLSSASPVDTLPSSSVFTGPLTPALKQTETRAITVFETIFTSIPLSRGGKVSWSYQMLLHRKLTAVQVANC